VNATMQHMDGAGRVSRRVNRSPVTWLLAAVVVLVIAIALAAGLAASAVRVPADTPTPAPTACTVDGMTGPCS
jgi:hypothetical protein